MKKIASLSRILEGIIMKTFPRRSSLMAIVLSLSALSPISLSAADVTYPQPNPTTDTVLVTGVAPTTVAAGQVKIGGGVIRAGNSVVVGTDPAPTGSELLRVGGTMRANAATIATNGGNQRVELGVAGAQQGYLRILSPGGSREANLYSPSTGGLIIDTNSNTFPINLRGSSVIIGMTDPNPGGAELLRVGGAARFQAAGNVDSNFKSTTATGRAIVGPENDSGSTIQLVAFGNSVTGTTFGSNNANAVMLCATKYGAQDPAIMGIGTFTSTPLILGTNNAERVRLEAGGEIVFKGVAPASVANGEVRMGGGRVMVGGTLSAKEIKVTTTGADYVFDDTYRLRPLMEVEQFIKDNRHLPEIPSAKVMQQDGMGVSEIVTKQLAKIEELTLYAIQAQKERDLALVRADAAQAVAKATQDQVAAQEVRIQRLENLIRNLSPAVAP